MTKLQITNSKQYQNTKFKIQNCFEFEYLNLGFICHLVFGAWNLSISERSEQC